MRGRGEAEREGDSCVTGSAAQTHRSHGRARSLRGHEISPMAASAAQSASYEARYQVSSHFP